MRTNDATKPSRRRWLQVAGFEPVVIGGLARAKDFDVGTPIFGKPMTAAEVRRTLGIRS